MGEQDYTSIEERADYISEESLISITAKDDFFDLVHKKLTARGTTLIVGPRGCGKTHMMRYTSLVCRNDSSQPLGVYVSFNKYLRLEPLLQTKSNAIDLFHTWVLAQIVLSTWFQSIQGSLLDNQSEFEFKELEQLVVKLERGLPLIEKENSIVEKLSVKSVIAEIEKALTHFKRSRAVLLLDDAALTLTPDYLFEFFDLVRTLKTSKISPKASVYPGTTEYGPRFHVAQEAEMVSVWLSIAQENYSNLMGAIAERRFSQISEIPSEISELFKYAAFGIPRAYLTMLRAYMSEEGKTSQQVINKIIEDHNNVRISEYKSLKVKMPKFESLIETGEKLFGKIVQDLVDANQKAANSNENHLIVGLQDVEVNPLVMRMISLLVEVGLLFEHQQVSHGPERTYLRYTPHVSALILGRAFSQGQRGFSARQLVDFIERRPAKHPIRRTINKLLSKDTVDGLSLDLPPCRVCNAPRLNDSQKFCHNCGNELSDSSTFEMCMSVPIANVPGITEYQKNQIMQKTPIKTVNDFLAVQNLGTELLKIHYVGPVRATKITDQVEVFVDEFLS